MPIEKDGKWECITCGEQFPMDEDSEIDATIHEDGCHAKEGTGRSIAEKEALATPNLVVFMKFGSHLYGTDTPNSDKDFKGIAMPTKEDILLGNVPKNIIKASTGIHKVKNTKKDCDVEVMTLHQFFKLAIEGQVVALDMLFANDASIIVDSPIWRKIKEIRHMFLSKNTYAFTHYINKQAAKYGIKGSRLNAMKLLIDFLEPYPEDTRLEDIDEASLATALNEHTRILKPGDEGNVMKKAEQPRVSMLHCCGKNFHLTFKVKLVRDSIEKLYQSYGARAFQAANNEGVDWKAISHAFRAVYQMKELFLIKHITMPRQEAEFLKDVKMGKFEYNGVANLLEDAVDEVRLLRDKSDLPDYPDVDYLNGKLMEWTLEYLTS